MKRNMDLVRKILIEIHNGDHGYYQGPLVVEGHSNEEVGYHCYLLSQAGLIEAADVSGEGHGSPHALPMNLTWAGHEFVENAYNDSIWEQTRGVVSRVGNASFTIWANVLSKVVTNSLGLDN
ncbi:DUF2513 domain-containing protein [Marinimicrobium sp. LS-A18]|uniref:DUF2513 domain-containing protein n=1 Tax=Marinimicrobium sp. LS-A18 TaxID=1381596 RepID=UPI0009DC47F8|nr:DUF2513 domain-containing protein [Marinimicrobium sp. LS-A18]